MSFVDQAKRYSNIKYSLAIVDTLYLALLLFLFLALGLSKLLAAQISRTLNSPYLLIPGYLLAIYIIYTFLDLPLNFYRSFIVEHKFHLTQQRLSNWISDQLKGGIISYIIGLVLLVAFYYILANFPQRWWLIISLFWICLSLILAKVTPIVIIPLFFKYKKLSDEVLRQRILNLATKMKIKILDCFEINLSSKTLKANAAFVGIGKTRRVILADTLKDKYTHDEIEVILAHEFSHYKLKHLLKLILVNSLFIIIAFYLLFKTSGFILGWFDLSSLSEIAALPVIFLYLLLLGIVAQPFENYISRGLERNADMLCLKITGLKEAFVSMMEKLAVQNLADRKPHPLIKFFFFDHPPVNERIAMAKSL